MKQPPNSCHSFDLFLYFSAKTIFKVGLSILLLSSDIFQKTHGFEYHFEENRCKPPEGSYKDSCKVSGKRFFSTDARLKKPMCQIDLSCETADQTSFKNTTFFLPEKLLGCVSYIENCDGEPVASTYNKRACINPDDARHRGKYQRMDL